MVVRCIGDRLVVRGDAFTKEDAMNDFQFSDLSRVSWGPTLKLAAGCGPRDRCGIRGRHPRHGDRRREQEHSSGRASRGSSWPCRSLWAVLGPLLALLYWAAGVDRGQVRSRARRADYPPASALIICWGDPIL